jgi:hypothetical protein
MTAPQAPQPVYQFPYPTAYHGAGTSQASNVTPWIGQTRAEVERPHAAAAEASGATKPKLMVPFDDDPSQRIWTRELDGGYTLRSLYDIQENLKVGVGGEFRPGQTEGSYYFHCLEKK